MGEEWKDLYKKPQELTTPHTGPILFYNDLVIDHFTNPRNVGEIEKLAHELKKNNFTDDEIEKIFSKNALRVIKDNL